MALKKTSFSDEEIVIFDEAVIYKRGLYWQFRMWLEKEHKYYRRSLKTNNQSTAIQAAKTLYHQIHADSQSGKTQFSLATKQGVEIYVKYREKDVETGAIVKERLGTIKTHLEHWLNFIKKDTKLKELQRTDCENYALERTKTKKKIPANQTTIKNEQSTINAMMKYLFRRNETFIDSFDFRKFARLDSNDDAIRRSTFTTEEAALFEAATHQYLADVEHSLDDDKNLIKFICCYYYLFAMLSGLRTGEQRQLKWSDLDWDEHTAVNAQTKKQSKISIIKLKIRAETSKWRKSRTFEITDKGYLDDYRSKIWAKHKENGIANSYVFSKDGKSAITERAILYNFEQILALTKIKNTDKRNLVPYSFRHFFITQKVNSGVNILHIKNDAGTSITHIEKTYYHTDKATLRNSALAGYTVSADGTNDEDANNYST
jgi:integrase